MEPTPSTNAALPQRLAQFSTLAEALDYAARGDTGCNFYNGKGALYSVLPYRELRERAVTLARRLIGAGLPRGSHFALVADTGPEFHTFFFACQYAGLVPVPLPVSIHLGSRKAYVQQLRRLLQSCQAVAAMAPADYAGFLAEAAAGLDLRACGAPETFEALPEADVDLRLPGVDDIAYLQYTSGSTRFPRGVMITQRAVMSNLYGIQRYGLQLVPGDRAVSWLPFYHDMGLVGFVLGPVVSQLSIDYLSTRDFAMRPRQWLSLISRNGGSISFSPPFGYELCARRLREGEAQQYDLRSWRVAGVGAEMIRPETLQQFADTLAESGFDAKAFLACYGMAESSLALTFAELGAGMVVERVDRTQLAEANRAETVAEDAAAASVRSFVNCGRPLPDHEIEIRDENGAVVGERECGTIYARGPSIMLGYFNDPQSTAAVLDGDGWLNTGDIGYRTDGTIVVTGRKKDLIIIHGRNIWPQDLEWIAERQPELRVGDASAFSVTRPDGEEMAVMVVQCRVSEPERRADLTTRLQGLIRQDVGIDCHIELVPPRTLPRTSSGKLSRSKAREEFLQRVHWDGLSPARPAETRVDAQAV